MLNKIVYFLLACDEKKAFKFLQKNRFLVSEEKALPDGFIKKSKLAFERNKKSLVKEGLEDESLVDEKDKLPWKNFCKKSSYEEVLPLVMCGILGYSLEKGAWLLKIHPETLSYRFKQGLLILGEELKQEGLRDFDFLLAGKNRDFYKSLMGERPDRPFKKSNKDTSLKAFSSLELTMKDDLNRPLKEKALMYCDLLSQADLPKILKEISFNQKNQKTRRVLFYAIGCLFFVIVGWVVSFLWSLPSQVILYQSP